MNRNLVPLLLVVIPACSPFDMAKVAQARSAIESMLNDPKSAQWKNIDVTGPCVRGEVNAKNGFGGYTAFAPFFYNADTKEAGIDPGNSTDAELTLGLTERHDAQLSYSAGLTKCIEAATAAVKKDAGLK